MHGPWKELRCGITDTHAHLQTCRPGILRNTQGVSHGRMVEYEEAPQIPGTTVGEHRHMPEELVDAWAQQSMRVSFWFLGKS